MSQKNVVKNGKIKPRGSIVGRSVGKLRSGTDNF
jgi:hypothetical protein